MLNRHPQQGKPSEEHLPTTSVKAARAPVRHGRARWLRFATLTLVVTPIGLVLRDLDQQRRIDQALAEIREVGGLFARDDKARGRPVVSIEFDALFFDDAGHEHRKPPATDEILPRLSCFDRLRELSLQRSAVTDAGLSNLMGMRSLRRLSLRGSSITDVGLRFLAKMTWLQEIDLVNTQATAQGIAELHQSLPGALILSSVR
jgi:hypothetical protein